MDVNLGTSGQAGSLHLTDLFVHKFLCPAPCPAFIGMACPAPHERLTSGIVGTGSRKWKSGDFVGQIQQELTVSREGYAAPQLKPQITCYFEQYRILTCPRFKNEASTCSLTQSKVSVHQKPSSVDHKLIVPVHCVQLGTTRARFCRLCTGPNKQLTT